MRGYHLSIKWCTIYSNIAHLPFILLYTVKCSGSFPVKSNIKWSMRQMIRLQTHWLKTMCLFRLAWTPCLSSVLYFHIWPIDISITAITFLDDYNWSWLLTTLLLRIYCTYLEQKSGSIKERNLACSLWYEITQWEEKFMIMTRLWNL